MIGIRVDGNGKIGMGHISRCLSVASALREKHLDPCFICSSDTSINQIEESGFRVAVVQDSLYDNWSMEGEENCIRINKISTMLIDSYYVSEESLQRIHSIVKVVFLDDLQLYDYDVDVIINYNIDASKKLYKNTKYISRKMYLGIGYFPLRQSLQYHNEKIINREVKNVLITTGSTDPLRCIEKLISGIHVSSYEDIKFSIILGLFFDEAYCKCLKERYSNDHIVFLPWGQDMKKIYLETDLVIAPGSTTVYEALSLGRPCISFQFEDNQHEECVVLDKMGIVPFAGDFSNDFEDAEMFELFRNELSFTRRKERFNRFMNLFDGNGANRIADIIAGVNHED